MDCNFSILESVDDFVDCGFVSDWFQFYAENFCCWCANAHHYYQRTFCGLILPEIKKKKRASKQHDFCCSWKRCNFLFVCWIWVFMLLEAPAVCVSMVSSFCGAADRIICRRKYTLSHKLCGRHGAARQIRMFRSKRRRRPKKKQTNRLQKVFALTAVSRATHKCISSLFASIFGRYSRPQIGIIIGRKKYNYEFLSGIECEYAERTMTRHRCDIRLIYGFIDATSARYWL